MMNRKIIHRISSRAPIVMSLLALATVLISVLTGWGQQAGDEGAAAHIFQLLIAAQAPILLAFLVTAQWNRWRELLSPMALQAGTIALALGSVAFFRL